MKIQCTERRTVYARCFFIDRETGWTSWHAQQRRMGSPALLGLANDATVTRLKGELHSPLDLSSSAERVYAGAVPDSERLVVEPGGTVNRTWRTREQPRHCVRRQ